MKFVLVGIELYCI